MKKLLLLSVAALLFLVWLPASHAKTYYRTYEITKITGEGIVLKDVDTGGMLILEKDPEGYKVGDLVRYDAVRNVLKKSAWQPGHISKMTDTTITLQLSNGEQAQVNMRSSYRGQFKEGEAVLYKAASDQIKKYDLLKPEAE